MVSNEINPYKEFQINIRDYLYRTNKYLSERFPSYPISEAIRIQMTKSGKIESIEFNMIDGIFKELELLDIELENNYRVKISENIKPRKVDTIVTRKHSYEIKNQNNIDDFVRFDYKPYENFTHNHINASATKYGQNNHLEYPTDIPINFECLDCFQAIDIFNAFIKDYIEGNAKDASYIVECLKNNCPKYISKLNQGAS